MSVAQRDAVVQEVLDQAQLWRTMAAQRHGVPFAPQPRNRVSENRGPAPPTRPAPPVETMAEPSPNPPILAAPVTASAVSRLSKAVLAGAVLATGGVGLGAGMLGTKLWQASQAPAAMETAEATGSLLGWLRENGYHVAPPAPGESDGE